VTNPGRGTATVVDDYIVYTPNSAFSGIDSFQYTIFDGEDDLSTSTATVTIFGNIDPSKQTVDISFDVFDPLDPDMLNPLTQINVGSQFVLVASVQDLRSQFEAQDRRGIFAAYLDVLFEREFVSPNFDAANELGFAITFDQGPYGQAESGNILTPGLLDEVGAYQDSGEPLGPSKQELFRVVFTANDKAGVVNFTGDPADEILNHKHDVLYYQPPEPMVPLAAIRYGLTSLTIVKGETSTSGTTRVGVIQGQPLDVNNDAFISASDALMVINHLNNSVGRDTLSNSRLDVNRDTFVSPIDVLLVVNYLNRLSRGEGEGEGEGGAGLLSVSGDGATSQLDLLAASQLVTTVDVASPAMSFQHPLLPAGAIVLPNAADAATDWQLQIGQSDVQPQGLPGAADLVDEPWESLLDTLAADVLEAWLDGAGA
jgi:hypothetical protein